MARPALRRAPSVTAHHTHIISHDAPTPRNLTGLPFAIGIAIIVLVVWFFIRIGAFVPPIG
jgi:hypothetical protein